MRGSILIIDDDHDVRVSLRETLEAEGYSVFSATNGRDGIEMLRRIKRPDLLLVDQNMPLMSGEEFLHLKNADRDLFPIPAVVISAVPNQSSGASAFIRKPISLDELLGLVQKHCRKLLAPEVQNQNRNDA